MYAETEMTVTDELGQDRLVELRRGWESGVASLDGLKTQTTECEDRIKDLRAAIDHEQQTIAALRASRQQCRDRIGALEETSRRELSRDPDSFTPAADYGSHTYLGSWGARAATTSSQFALACRDLLEAFLN